MNKSQELLNEISEAVDPKSEALLEKAFQTNRAMRGFLEKAKKIDKPRSSQISKLEKLSFDIEDALNKM